MYKNNELRIMHHTNEAQKLFSHPSRPKGFMIKSCWELGANKYDKTFGLKFGM